MSDAMRDEPSTQEIPLFAALPHQKDALRVQSEPDGDSRRRQLLTMKVVDGRLTAEYDPADLDEAAKQFVDAVMQRWTAEMDAMRQFTADTLGGMLRDAARQQGTGETISVDHAATVVATLLWGCR